MGSAEFLGLEWLTSFLAMCQKTVGKLITVSHIRHLSVMCSCQFSSVWRGWSLFRGGELEHPGHPEQAVSSCLGWAVCESCYTEPHYCFSRRRHLSCWDTVENTLKEVVLYFLINLMILVTNCDYISVCAVPFYSILMGFYPPPQFSSSCVSVIIWLYFGLQLLGHFLSNLCFPYESENVQRWKRSKRLFV